MTRPGHSEAAIDFSFKKSDQSKLSIFYFKNFSRGVSVLQNSCCRRWPGLLRTCQARWCGFAPELDNCWNAFVRTMCFLLCFFLFCVPAFFFPFVFAKSMMRSFCLVNFCVLLHVFMCVVQNQLFIDLFASLFFVFLCTFPCLPYFLQCFLAVLHCFFIPNYSNLHVCVFAGSAWYHLHDLTTQID